MAEDYTLDTPITPPVVTTTTYRVRGLNLDFEAVSTTMPPPVFGEVPAPPVPGLVTIRLRSNAGATLTCTYEGQQAQDMMKWMNTANFSTTSMQKRILQKLEQDGKLPPGEITGAPDPPPAEL